MTSGPTLASPDEGYWAIPYPVFSYAVEDSNMLVDSCCTDHIATNIDAFLDFVPIQSKVRNPNGDVSRVGSRGCATIDNEHTLKQRGTPMRTQNCGVCLTILQTSYQSQDTRCGDIASLSRKVVAA